MPTATKTKTRAEFQFFVGLSSPTRGCSRSQVFPVLVVTYIRVLNSWYDQENFKKERCVCESGEGEVGQSCHCLWRFWRTRRSVQRSDAKNSALVQASQTSSHAPLGRGSARLVSTGRARLPDADQSSLASHGDEGKREIESIPIPSYLNRGQPATSLAIAEEWPSI